MRHLLRTAAAATLSLCLAAAPVTTAMAASAYGTDAKPVLAPSTANTEGPSYKETGAATNGILVTLDAQASESASLLGANEGSLQTLDAAQELKARGIKVTGQLDGTDSTAILTAQPVNGQTDEEALDAARTTPGVVSAQPNFVYHLTEPIPDAGTASLLDASTPSLAKVLSLLPANDPYTAISGSSSAYNQYWAYNAKLPGAWREAKSSGSVTIAVLDSGVRLDHEDLAANLLASLAWDADTGTALTGTGDTIGHGTHVAGIAAGVANNARGMAGASYNAKLLPIKVTLGTSSDVDSRTVIAAYNHLFELIDSGAAPDIHVVNMSLGGSSASPLYDHALEDVIARARSQYRIATVCSGGNSGNKYSDNYPSDFEESIAVTALDADGNAAPYSDYNAAKDISAPGIGIWSTWNTGTSDYRSVSGTSMASPIVAGTVALMFAVKPEATVDEICDALYGTATAVPNQPAESGSHGAVNAQAAVNQFIDAKAAPNFSDVSDQDWFFSAAGYVAKRGIMTGYLGTNLFGPNNTITRADAATALYKYLGNGEIHPAVSLEDVDQGAYYAKAVNWAVAHGIMNGYSGTSYFGVNDTLTRQQVAVIYANLLASSDEISNTDTSPLDAMPDASTLDDWGGNTKAKVAWALNASVINGVESNGTRELQPRASTTRAMMAAMLKNSIGKGLL